MPAQTRIGIAGGHGAVSVQWFQPHVASKLDDLAEFLITIPYYLDTHCMTSKSMVANNNGDGRTSKMPKSSVAHNVSGAIRLASLSMASWVARSALV